MGTIVGQVLDDMHPVLHLQELLLKAATPPNDYLIHGNPVERTDFERLRRAVDCAT